MTYCNALLKSEKPCTAQAKYALREHGMYFCKTHALTQANLKLDTKHLSIEEVPGLYPLGQRVADDNITEILEHVDSTHGYTLKVGTYDWFKTYHEFGVTDVHENKYVLRVVKSLPQIERFVESSAAYAALLPTLDLPICIPTISYEQAESKRTCLVRGWEHARWYYELCLPEYPVIMTDRVKLVMRLVDLIEYSHEHRVVHGSIELRNLSQLKVKRVSTTVFKSLRNAMFWEGRYGQTVESDTPLDSNIKFDAITCAKRMNQKQHPCRYDDFESLLYLVMQLIGRPMPWAEMIDQGEILYEKNHFVQKHAGQDEAPLARIAQLIVDCHFDDRPNYSVLREQFALLAA